jgi:hypothetical protein
MVDVIIVSSQALAEKFGAHAFGGPVLVVFPSGILTFSEFLELEEMKPQSREGDGTY